MCLRFVLFRFLLGVCVCVSESVSERASEWSESESCIAIFLFYLLRDKIAKHSLTLTHHDHCAQMSAINRFGRICETESITIATHIGRLVCVCVSVEYCVILAWVKSEDRQCTVRSTQLTQLQPCAMHCRAYAQCATKPSNERAMRLIIINNFIYFVWFICHIFRVRSFRWFICYRRFVGYWFGWKSR